MMEFTTIPQTDMDVSRISLGTWAIGGWMWGGTDEKESIRTIHAAMENGVNLIDTAPVYGFGKSEEIVGKAIKEYGSRDKLFISTKATLEWTDEGKIVRNSTPLRIFSEVEDSLKRLQTDYIDIYYIHWPDPLVEFETTAQAMMTLLSQGKIRAIGVSNFSPDQMEKFRRGGAIQVAQPPYNIFEREIEEQIMPFCRRTDIHLMTYGALCRGLLSGKMSRDREFEGDDLRKIDPKFQQPRFDQYLSATEELTKLARQRFGKNLLTFAVRWVLDKGVDIALWGARRPDQMTPVSEVFGWNIDDETMAAVDLILKETVTDPVGPEFMAPPARGR